MIYELVPIIVEKYINENQEKLLLNIQTMINGHCVGTDAIIESIQKELVNQLKFWDWLLFAKNENYDIIIIEMEIREWRI